MSCCSRNMWGSGTCADKPVNTENARALEAGLAALLAQRNAQDTAIKTHAPLMRTKDDGGASVLTQGRADSAASVTPPQRLQDVHPPQDAAPMIRAPSTRPETWQALPPWASAQQRQWRSQDAR